MAWDVWAFHSFASRCFSLFIMIVVCVGEREGMWSEDNLTELVLNFCFYVGSGAGTQVRRGQQAFLGLSVLSSPHDVIFCWWTVPRRER